VSCPSCAEIEAIERGGHPWAVARLRGGYVWLNPTQYYEGATFYVSKRCVAELHDLEVGERRDHLMEMAAVAAAVFDEFAARKMNYEALGNSVPHLHWWLTPRHQDDPRPGGPIWEDLDFLRALWTKAAEPDADRATVLRSRILQALERQGAEIESTYV
jgi:diadenosine tetraphosphate (Ap4A) HIT family hydrolase